MLYIGKHKDYQAQVL